MRQTMVRLEWLAHTSSRNWPAAGKAREYVPSDWIKLAERLSLQFHQLLKTAAMAATYFMGQCRTGDK